MRNSKGQFVKRDNMPTKICGICNTLFEKSRQISYKQWAFYPEVRFDLSNGRTLCVDCHRKTKTWGNRILINNNL